MNSMNKISEIYGLKLGEPFRLKNVELNIIYDGDYYFSEDGFHGPNGMLDAMFDFMNLLIGKYEIVL